jgi:glycosyltransferase involved in cell wall biosynthesis
MTQLQKRGRRLRVGVLTNTVPGYRRPVLEKIAQELGVKLEVFVSLPVDLADKEAQKSLSLHYSKGFNLQRRTMHRDTGTDQVEWLHIPVMLFFDLLRFRPDVIISGEFGLRSVIAFLAARCLRAPFVLWSEEIKENASAATGVRQWLRGLLIRRADAFLAWGKPAVEYLQMWNVPSHKIHYCAQAVDNGFWSGQAHQCQRDQFRQERGLRNKVFLAVGRLMARKGFDKLLLAWDSMESHCKQENMLVLVGGGPEDASLKEMVRSRSIPNVVFVGPQSPEDLAQWYAAADVFVFPSLVDVWGLVVNEAMACGLPVLASKYAGASQELVNDQGIGELFDPIDIERFGAMLQRWCLNDVKVDNAYIYSVVEKLNFDVSVASFRRIFVRHTVLA